MNNKPFVLITCPKTQLLGGVANFYRSLKTSFSHNVATYFFINATSDNGFVLIKAIKFVCDNIKLLIVLVTNFNYKVVHVNPSLALFSVFRDGLFLLIAKLCRRRVIVFFHGWNPEAQNKIVGMYLHIFCLIFRKSDTICVLTQDAKKWLQDNNFNMPIVILTTAIDDGFVDSIKSFKKDQTKHNILFLARVEKEKGIFILLEAYKLLLDNKIDVTLTVAGDGTALDLAKKFVSTHNIKNVNFLGYVRGDDKIRCYANANVYCLPTFTEGLPITVLEAISCGIPVLTRPVGGLPQVIMDGKNGFLIESLSSQVWFKYLQNALLNDQCKSSFLSYFSSVDPYQYEAKFIAQKLIKLYQNIM